MTTTSRLLFAVIVERNGQEIARDVVRGGDIGDPRSLFMRQVKAHELDTFDEPVNCRIEEISE